jgi:hypothetical protein
MQANLNPFDLISTNMSHVQPEGKKTLDHTKLSPASFGKADHNAYKQKLNQVVPVTRSIRKWSNDEDPTLQDCFTSTDGNMFWDSFYGIDEYTTSDIDLINKCIDDAVTTLTICTYPNQKPSMPSDEPSNK